MKIRIMSLLTILCIALSSMAFGQNNIVKRNSCTSFGCSTLPVTLSITGSAYAPPKTINCPDAGKTYPISNNKIKVTIEGKTSTGTYYLPTAVGGSTTIPAGDPYFGSYGYSVGITKTADKEFRLTLTKFEGGTSTF